MVRNRKEMIVLILSVCITVLLSFVFMMTNIQTKVIDSNLALILVMQVVSLILYVFVEEVIKKQNKVKEIKNKKAMISVSLIILLMTFFSIC